MKRRAFESFRYRFLAAASSAAVVQAAVGKPGWPDFIGSIEFTESEGSVVVGWRVPSPGQVAFKLEGIDPLSKAADEVSTDDREMDDPLKVRNERYFRDAVALVAERAGYGLRPDTGDSGRIGAEKRFHDAWASEEDITAIDVRAMAEACTSPELRHITSTIGDLRGKRFLDLGCGLGEASVYFALKGAVVTSSDISPGMLDATSRLASRYGVAVTPHLASAENPELPARAVFDVIYAGNLLHHVDIADTIKSLKRHLAPGGVLVTWDPLAYNPVINVYRAIATEVRTSDEHPLKWRDLKLFEDHFESVGRNYFWLSTLVIFIIMALLQRRNPNKERFWKVVVKEERKWRWLYQPLERLDSVLLALFPPLRLLCWNVVVTCGNPRSADR